MIRSKDTSWHQVGKWYTKTVGESGHYFHTSVIFPKLNTLFPILSSDQVLDVGCGNGVYAHQLPKSTHYLGIDSAVSLISEAQKADKNPQHKFLIADATKTFNFPNRNFSKAIFLLSLQNMDQGDLAINNVSQKLRSGGQLCLVLNHPAFRIPRQSSWVIDEAKKTEFRRLDRYLTPLKIPITAHPGEDNSPVTWSFHNPISQYFSWLQAANFVITTLEEWASDKTSQGKAARMENRARSEFPLFLTILATKK